MEHQVWTRSRRKKCNRRRRLLRARLFTEMAQVSPPGVHDSAVGLSNNVLSKREPIPALVLCWGWLLKQVRLREHCRAAERGCFCGAVARVTLSFPPVF